MDILTTNKKNILLVLHKSPDADAVASAYIITQILKRRNPDHSFYVVTDSGFRVQYPKNLGIQEFSNQITNREIPEDCCAFIIDHSRRAISLLRNWYHPNIKEMVVIDHHKGYDVREGAKTLIEEEASCTGIVLFNYLKENSPEDITPDIATAIYIALFTDTLYWRKPVKEQEFLDVHELITKYGAEVNKYNIYLKQRYFIYRKRVAELLFLCTSKSKRCNCVTLTLTNDKLRRVIEPNKISLIDIENEILSCGAVYHLLCRVEYRPGLWIVKLMTRNLDFIKTLEQNGIAFHPDKYVWCSLNEEEAKIKLKNLRDRLARWEENQQQLDAEFFLHLDEPIINKEEGEPDYEDFEEELGMISMDAQSD